MAYLFGKIALSSAVVVICCYLVHYLTEQDFPIAHKVNANIGGASIVVGITSFALYALLTIWESR